MRLAAQMRLPASGSCCCVPTSPAPCWRIACAKLARPRCDDIPLYHTKLVDALPTIFCAALHDRQDHLDHLHQQQHRREPL